jgi:hypothetical protein
MKGESILLDDKSLIEYFVSESITMAITGRKIEEIKNEINGKGNLELNLYLNKILKMSFQKRIFEY